MAKWKFQLLPNTRDLLGVGFRMDAIGESVEAEVNEGLPYRFRFHRIGKIVLCLGPPERPVHDYVELIGVAQKQMPTSNIRDYAASSDDQRIALLRGAVLEAFAWFEAKFDDAQFIAVATAKLQWASDVPPNTSQPGT